MSAYGAFVVAFQVASTIVFILQCIPIRDFWTTLGGDFNIEPSGRCVDVVKFLLVNGCINTATDFALLLLVCEVPL